MIKSMTGYGKAAATLEGGTLNVEIRCVNGKAADISVKTSLLPKDKEMEVRKRLSSKLVRGTIDLFLSWEPNAASDSREINMALARGYFSQVEALRSELGVAASDGSESLLAAVLRFPGVVDAAKGDIVTEENWPLVEAAIEEAASKVDAFRTTEGAILRQDVSTRVERILELSREVESYEPERLEAVRQKLQKGLSELGAKPDKERFEQELIFYIEKLDINEERVRLRQHCKYFLETMDNEDCPGKKLGFIIQEMGREINTTGSKANHAGIQKAVVLMKDELEKIREQSLNIL